MMDKHLPARYYQNLELDDLFTDTVCDSNGKNYPVTLTVRNWKNIDWINKNAKVLTEGKLVDDALFELVSNPNSTLSDSVSAALFYFVKSFQDARKERLAKEKSNQETRKDTVGNA